MKNSLAAFSLLAAILAVAAFPGSQLTFKVLAFYSDRVERDHVLFANDALKFLSSMAAKDNFELVASTDWNRLNEAALKTYSVVLWINDSPHTIQQREAFQKYMTNGGAWMGFHAAGYNDASTRWPWFVGFLGGAVFYTNSWPPLPAKLRVDDRTHPILRHVPQSFLSPANEWYLWRPSPRLNKDVRVLLTLDPSNYPIGFKDVLIGGDLPVVWTNTKYRMIYMNMGHGDKILSDPLQNTMIEDAMLWLGKRSEGN